MRTESVGLALFVPMLLSAQAVPDRAGDSTVVRPTYAATQIIYDSARAPAFMFIAGNALDIAGANATEMQATFLDGKVARIVAGTWGSAGKYAIELYFRNDSLLFTFDSFEYLAETAPAGQWQNFRKIPAWQRRIFWQSRDAAFVESSGCSAALTTGDRERLLRVAGTLREMMKTRAPTRSQ